MYKVVNNIKEGHGAGKFMFLTESVNGINGRSSWVVEYLPDVVINLIKIVVTRLESILGVVFYMYLPLMVDTNNRTAWQIIKKLEKLKKLNVVSNYHTVMRQYDDEPHVKAVQINLVSDNKNNASGYGRSLVDQDEAWGPAFGEAVERWSVENFTPERSTFLSARELESSLGYALTDLPGLSDESGLVNKRHQINDDTKFLCVRTQNLRNNSVSDVPLQWFSFKHSRHYVHTHKEPLLAPTITTGAAAGRCYDEALLGALLENVERDAFMIHWLRKITPKQLDVRSCSNLQIRSLLDITDRYCLETYFLKLETDFPVEVILCVVVDRSGIGPALTIDACAGVSQLKCMIKAFEGAIGLRQYVRRKQDEALLLDKTIDPERLDLSQRVVWWSDPQRLSDIEFMLRGPQIPVRLKVRELTKKQTIAHLIGHAKNKKYDMFCLDIVSKSVKRAGGLDVLFVKMPHLQPLYLEEQNKAWRGDRLWSMPKELGLETGTEGINTTPHPFA